MAKQKNKAGIYSNKNQWKAQKANFKVQAKQANYLANEKQYEFYFSPSLKYGDPRLQFILFMSICASLSNSYANAQSTSQNSKSGVKDNNNDDIFFDSLTNYISTNHISNNVCNNLGILASGVPTYEGVIDKSSQNRGARDQHTPKKESVVLDKTSQANKPESTAVKTSEPQKQKSRQDDGDKKEIRSVGAKDDYALFEKIVSQINSKNHTFTHIDLSKINTPLTEELLTRLNKAVQGSEFVGHISWGDLRPSTQKLSKLASQIENKIVENNKSYKYYPSDFLHGLLSSHVYKDANKDDIVEFKNDDPEHKYNSYLKNWRVHEVLNDNEGSGYYGAIYINDHTKQMVLAHRGTTFDKIDLFKPDSAAQTDIKGILGGQIVAQQVTSYVVTKNATEYAKGNHYHLSITGHSLGAWIAELSLYFCHRDFSYSRVKAVTFDSPGSVVHMDKLKSNIINDNTKFDIQTLDITTYLSAPNFVNSCNQHVGKVYRLFPEISKPEVIDQISRHLAWIQTIPMVMDKLKENSFLLDGLLAITGHSLTPMLSTFGLDGDKPINCQEVLDWPAIKYTPKGANIKHSTVKGFVDAIPFSNFMPDFLRDAATTAISQAIPDTAMTSLLNVLIELINGNIDTGQYFSTHQYLDKYTVSTQLSDRQEFSLAYEGHYRTQKLNLSKSVLAIENKGSADWYLVQLAKLSVRNIDQKKFSVLIKNQLESIKEQYKVNIESGKEYIYAKSEIKITDLREQIMRLIEINEEVKEMLNNPSSHAQNNDQVNHCGVIISNLPSTQMHNFVSKEGVFEEIATILNDNQFLVISAFAGTGKSTNALEYGYRKKNDLNDPKIVRWFNADSADKIDEAYRNLALELGITIVSEKTAMVMQLVNNKIASLKSSMLFIFDNVQKYSDIRDYLNSLSNLAQIHVQVIITTDHNDLDSSLKYLKLAPFNKEEAISYIKNSLGTTITAQEIELLIKELGTKAKETEVLPYTLSKAVAYLKEHKTSTVEKYIKYFKDNKDDDHAETTLLLKLLDKSPIAWQMLQYAAHLDPDFISLEVFKELLVIDEDQLETHIKSLESLSLMSFIKKDGNNGLQVHRVVQDTLKKYISRHPGHAIAPEEVYSRLLESLNNLLPRITKMSEEGLRVAELFYSHAIKILDNELQIKQVEQMDLYFKLADYTSVICEFEQSSEYHNKALMIYQNLYPDNSDTKLSTNSSLSQALSPQEEVDIRRIAELIDEGHSRIFQENQTVIFIGDTGSGKSTLFNYLSGIELEAKPGTGLGDEYIIDVKIASHGSKIGHKVVSETTTPYSWKNDTTGVMYWDCPGFFGNTGPVQNIVDAFYIKKIFEKSQNVKLVIVVEKNSLTGNRAEGFIQLLDSLRGLLRDFKDFKDGVSLVVTKLGKSDTLKKVSNVLQKIYDEKFKYLHEQDKEMLDFFIKHQEKIALFKAPIASGKIPVEDKVDILDTIQRTTFVAHKDVGITISDKSKIYINKLSYYTEKLILDKMSNLSEFIEDTCKRLVEKKQFKELYQLIKGIKPLLINLTDVSDIKTLQTIFDNVNLGNRSDLSTSIKHKFSDLIFFQRTAEQSVDQALLLSAISDLLQLKIKSVRENLVNAINAELNSYTYKFKDTIEQKSSHEGLTKLHKYKDFFNNILSRLDDAHDLDDLVILGKIQESFSILTINENNIGTCIEILKILNQDPKIYISEVKASCSQVVASLERKIDILTTAEAIIQGEFFDSIQAYMQTIDTNKDIENISIKTLNRNLTNLYSKLSNIVTRSEISLQDITINNFEGCSRVYISCLDQKRIDHSSYPNLKISSEVKAKLGTLQGVIKSWIEWYEIIPKVYNYLSVNPPVPQFLGGISDLTFETFLNIVRDKEQIVIDGVVNDPDMGNNQFKIAQLNKLIEATWQDVDHHHVDQQNNYETITITGNCIKVSDILEYIVPNHTKVLKIECFNTVYFDHELRSPGTNIIVIAPRWQIDDQVTVDLSGNNAQEHALAQAANGVGYNGINGSPGANGLPGLPGQNGGSFYGKGKEFIGLEHLAIETNGGNGARGQNGGNGFNGQNGTDAPQGATANGTNGGTGGDAGAGGVGGIAGYQGIVQIFQDMQNVSDACHHILANAGHNGLDGNHGVPGIGGKNGDGWYYHMTSYQVWVPQGKGGYHETKYNTDSHKNANPTHANYGRIPEHMNLIGQQLPQDDTHRFEKIKSMAIIEFRRHVEDMFNIGMKDDIVLKIQRPMLDQFIPRVGFGVIHHDGQNFDGDALVAHQEESYWNKYSKKAMEELIKLRLDSTDIKGAKVVIPNYIWDGTVASSHKLTEDILTNLSNNKETILVVLNLYGKHWVGMVIEKDANNIKINYIDSEQKGIPELLQQALVQCIHNEHLEYVVNFADIQVEQQKYNNCGPEVIENLIYYLTGERVDQESAVAVQSMLFEDTLMWDT